MLRNIFFIYFGDIAMEHMIIVRKIGAISLLCEFIPLGSKDTSPADSLKTNPQPTDSSEQIDKFERCFS